MTVRDGEPVVSDLLSLYGGPDVSVARLLCDRHPTDSIAFRVIEPNLQVEEISFGRLRERSLLAAAAFKELGVGAGDRVGVLMSKSRDLPTVLLGIWRLGATVVPLFTAFASPAIEMRLRASGAKAVVADADQVVKLGGLSTLVVQVGGERGGPPLLSDRMRSVDPSSVPTVRVGGDGTLILMFTSGTTGAPKGVPVPARALAAMVGYLRDGLDLREDDVYWNAADPGWAYGLFYGLAAPMAAGHASLILHATFDAERTWRVIQEFGVTNFAAAPTIYRALKTTQPAEVSSLRLRCMSSAGEPLTPDVNAWSGVTLGVEVRDHYGQTELGMVAANAWHSSLQEPIVPGSMGRSLPGWRVTVLENDADVEAAPGVVGRLAIDRENSPLMTFPGYYLAPAKTAERFTQDRRYYVTGDAARRDDEGRLYFSSRDDDVIIMAGYRIGPFEVESVLAAHPDVLEAAVIAAPDDLRGEVLEAFIVTRPGVEGSATLTRELQLLVKSDYASHAYPRRVHYATELPKTPSGKVQRFKLREQRVTEQEG